MGKELIKYHLHLHGLVSPWPGSSIEHNDWSPCNMTCTLHPVVTLQKVVCVRKRHTA